MCWFGEGKFSLWVDCVNECVPLDGHISEFHCILCAVVHCLSNDQFLAFVHHHQHFLLFLLLLLFLFCSLIYFCLLLFISIGIAVDDNVLKIRQQQSNFYRWIEAFRTHSHRIAQTNPIELQKNTRYLHTLTTIGSFDCIMYNSAKRNFERNKIQCLYVFVLRSLLFFFFLLLMLLLLLPNTNGFDCLLALIPSSFFTHTLILVPSPNMYCTHLYL